MKKGWKTATLFLFFVLCLTGCSRKEEPSFLLSEEKEVLSETEDPEEETETEAGPREVCVYVCGEVKNPGVYTLPAGERVCDAILAAGGMTDEAATDYWNQAEVLTDGEMIYIPGKEEASERQEAEKAVPVGMDGDGRIDINTASIEQLMTLPGIGEARAGSILKYREDHGGFASVEDLTNVSGIGNAMLENMRDSITVSKLRE